VKVFTKPEDLPEELRDPKSKRRAKWDAGWIQSALLGVQLNLATPSFLNGNYALRARFRPGGDNLHGIFLRRQAGNNSGLYQLKLSDNTLACQRREGERYHLVSSGTAASAKVAADEFTLEFAALGSKFFGRLDSRLLCAGTDTTHSAGVAGLYVNDMAVRDIEVLNLDGLSEAEALKILGVDEKGNDLRQPAALASASPAPSVSKSPSLTVSASSDKFSPGQWVKMFTKAEDLPEYLRKPDSGVKFEDGWIRTRDNNIGLRLTEVSSKNVGIKTRVRFDPVSKGYAALNLRSSPAGRLTLSRDRTGGLHRISWITGKSEQRPLATFDLGRSFMTGEHVVEFCVVGDRVISRFDDHLNVTKLADDFESGSSSLGGGRRHPRHRSHQPRRHPRSGSAAHPRRR
jgi:hypothetical protein